MSNIYISGITQSDFIARTKIALEEFSGSPIKKDRKVRQFLTSQLGLENEHTLPGVFTYKYQKVS